MDQDSAEHTPPVKRTPMNYVGMWCFRLFEWCIMLTPLCIISRIGMMLGWASYYIMPGRRRIVARNLRIAVDPTLRGKELNRLVRENFVRIGMSMMSSSKTATMSDAALAKCTRLEGPDTFDDEDLEKHGLVMAVAHSGNWELFSRTYTAFPSAKLYGSMYRQMDNPLMEEYLYAKRTNNGAHMFSKENGVNAPLAFVKSGGGLGVLSDQFVQEGFFVPYFGKVTGTTYLPALIQKRTKAKIKPCAAASDGPGRWIFHSDHGIAPSEGGSLVETTIAVNRMLEEQINKSPLDAFWMHNRWKVYEHFAPQDEKVLKALEGCDLKPFRILVATPLQADEAVLCIPMIKAIKNCRRDMQINIIAPPGMVSFWKTVKEVSHVVARGTAKEMEASLFNPEIYNDGPYDLAFLLDEAKETIKALKKFMPVCFSGFESHPCSDSREFKASVKTNHLGPVTHRVEDYLKIVKHHHLSYSNTEFFPSVRSADDLASSKGIAIAPFSTLGIADEWAKENWALLLQLLNEENVTLIALKEDKDRAEAFAQQLHIPVKTGDAAQLATFLGSVKALIAIDGLIPALSSHVGTPCVTLFGSRLPVRYRPLGSCHESLHRHRACSPCYRKDCDQKTKCVNDIEAQSVVEAFNKVTRALD